MTTAIRKHFRDFVAILVLVFVAAIVGGYILSNQRISFPGWVPIVGRETFILKGEFSTAQAVTPGQGQTVDIAGVQVGEISNVELRDGRALVTMRVDPRYSDIYTNATMLLRPKTGLKDMVVELDPGSSAGGKRVEDGYTVPISNTRPDVNFDEILAALDKDTQTYLQLLLQGAAVGLTGNGQELAQAFRMFDPLADDTKRATELLIERRGHIRRSITNFGKFALALSRSDSDLREYIDSSQRVFGRFAAQSENLQEALVLFPPALQQTQSALRATRAFADEAGPALEALRPFARALGPAMEATRPFMVETTPIFRDQIRPFTVAATPVVKTLRPVARDLAAATPNLVSSLRVLNEFFNALTYNPPGGSEGYLFYLTWLGHISNSALSTQDAMGAMMRAQLLVGCGVVEKALPGVKGSNIPAAAALTLATQLSNLPSSSPFCGSGG